MNSPRVYEERASALISSTLALAETVTTYSANILSPPQGVWQLGPLPPRGYVISILVGVLVGIYWMQRRYAARGGDPGLVLDIAIVIIPANITGGCLYHVTINWEKYFGPDANPVNVLKIANGGPSIWGAVVPGVLAMWAVAKWRKVPFAPVLDVATPVIILRQAIGRLGNWLSQELYGGPTLFPWDLEIYQRTDEFGRVVPVTGTSTGKVLTVMHSTLLCEMVWDVLAYLVIVWTDRKFKMGDGHVFVLYAVTYILGRFLIELVRVDDATLIFGVRINNTVSFVVFSCAVIALWILRAKGRETAAEVRREHGTAEAHSVSN